MGSFDHFYSDLSCTQCKAEASPRLQRRGLLLGPFGGQRLQGSLEGERQGKHAAPTTSEVQPSNPCGAPGSPGLTAALRAAQPFFPPFAHSAFFCTSVFFFFLQLGAPAKQIEPRPNWPHTSRKTKTPQAMVSFSEANESAKPSEGPPDFRSARWSFD